MVLWHWFWQGSVWEPAQNQCHSSIAPRPIDHSVEELLWEWIWVLWDWIWVPWEGISVLWDLGALGLDVGALGVHLGAQARFGSLGGREEAWGTGEEGRRGRLLGESSPPRGDDSGLFDVIVPPRWGRLHVM